MFLGAYNQYLQFCFRRLVPTDNPALQEIAERMLSLLKVVLLDIGLTLDAYFLQATQNLREALDLVFQANAELRQFAQFTSHDLKTPLATVANLCDEVLDEFAEDLPPDACQLIDKGRGSAFSMQRHDRRTFEVDDFALHGLGIGRSVRGRNRGGGGRPGATAA